MLWLGSSICGFEGMCEIDSGCGSAWLERLVWDQEVAGSNPVTPIELNIDFICASGSVVEHHLAKVGAAGSNPVSRFFYFVPEPLFCQGFGLFSSHLNSFPF